MTKILIRHSMCRDCWNKAYPGKSSVGHEAPIGYRADETCCFCGRKHKSGIGVRKNRNDRRVGCDCARPSGQLHPQ